MPLVAATHYLPRRIMPRKHRSAYAPLAIFNWTATTFALLPAVRHPHAVGQNSRRTPFGSRVAGRGPRTASGQTGRI